MLRVWMSIAIMAILVVAILTARVVLAQEASEDAGCVSEIQPTA